MERDRNCRPILTREIIAETFLSGHGIEVGALHNALSVPAAASVRYVDRLTKDKLYEHYPELREYDLVDIDYLDDGETLSSFKADSQDFIIANHFLEHCENPLGTLLNFLRVIRQGGVVYLALPDKRFTFDRDRTATPLDHVIRDYEEGPAWSRDQHFKEWAQDVDPHFGRVWQSETEINARANELKEMSYSIHFHSWEPADVLEMLNYCTKGIHMPLQVDLFATLGEEMVLILRKV